MHLQAAIEFAAIDVVQSSGGISDLGLPGRTSLYIAAATALALYSTSSAHGKEVSATFYISLPKQDCSGKSTLPDTITIQTHS